LASKGATARTAKVREAIPPELPTDFSDAISSIERDLNKHRIGTFRINAKDMTFKWTDRENRTLTSVERMTTLLKSMQNGLYRTDIRHRMSGVIARDKIEKRISSPDHAGQTITLKDTQRYNKQAMFPGILFPKTVKKEIKMQSGQHRMAVLQYLFPDNQENWWWIVTLYDRGMSIYLSDETDRADLPDAAKEALRLNEQDYRVAETEVDMWNQIVHLEGKLQELAHDPGTTAKFEAAKKRLEMGLGQRTKSMLSMPEYVEVINRILKMPGMHAEFISKNFEVFSKGRTVEVRRPTSWARPALSPSSRCQLTCSSTSTSFWTLWTTGSNFWEGRTNSTW
jgi:hypothetical protein